MAVANVDSVVAVDESSVQSEVDKLRGRWELASVLNFLNVDVFPFLYVFIFIYFFIVLFDACLSR